MTDLPKDVARLIMVANKVFNINITLPSRKRNYIDGRMVVCKILKDEGWRWTEIGRIFKKNHATIIYYVKSFDSYCVTDALLSQRYEEVREEYFNDNDPLYYLSGHSLRNLILELRKQNYSLSLQYSNLLAQVKEQEKSDENVLGLISMIRERTNPLKVEETEIKLNRLFNGVYS